MGLIQLVVVQPKKKKSIGGCSTIVGDHELDMTIWQASFCFVGYNNFGKHLHLNKSTIIYFRTINITVYMVSY